MEGTISFGYHYCYGSGNAVLTVPAEPCHNPGASDKETQGSDINDKVTCNKSRKFIIYITNCIEIYGAYDKLRFTNKTQKGIHEVHRQFHVSLRLRSRKADTGL
jgi:hypothetical protein